MPSPSTTAQARQSACRPAMDLPGRGRGPDRRRVKPPRARPAQLRRPRRPGHARVGRHPDHGRRTGQRARPSGRTLTVASLVALVAGSAGAETIGVTMRSFNDDIQTLLRKRRAGHACYVMSAYSHRVACERFVPSFLSDESFGLPRAEQRRDLEAIRIADRPGLCDGPEAPAITVHFVRPADLPFCRDRTQERIACRALEPEA